MTINVNMKKDNLIDFYTEAALQIRQSLNWKKSIIICNRECEILIQSTNGDQSCWDKANESDRKSTCLTFLKKKISESVEIGKPIKAVCPFKNNLYIMPVVPAMTQIEAIILAGDKEDYNQFSKFETTNDLVLSSLRLYYHYYIIRSVSKELIANLDLEEVLEYALQFCLDFIQADSGSIMLLDVQSKTLKINQAVGINPKIIAKAARKPGEGISGWVFKHGEPLILMNGIDDKRFNGVKKVKDSISFPLKIKGQAIGVLNINNKKLGNFSQSDINLLNDLSPLIAIAIKNAGLVKEINLNQKNLQKESEKLKDLSTEVIINYEKEKRRVVNCIEDELLQSIVAAQFQMDSLNKKMKKNERIIKTAHEIMPDEVEEALKILRSCIFDAQKMIQDIRPPSLDKFGLDRTVMNLLQRLKEESGIDFDFKVNNNFTLKKQYDNLVYQFIYRTFNKVIEMLDSPKINIKLFPDKSNLIISLALPGKEDFYPMLVKEITQFKDLRLTPYQQIVKIEAEKNNGNEVSIAFLNFVEATNEQD